MSQTKWFIGGFLMVMYFTYVLHATPVQLKRHIPGEFRPVTCAERLDTIRHTLYQVSIDESDLWLHRGDVQAAHYFQTRARTVKSTDGLDPSQETCSESNIRSLEVLAAQWQFDYALDGLPQGAK